MADHSEDDFGLDLSYESSIFEDDGDEEENDSVAEILPYQFEPILSENEEENEPESQDVGVDVGRLLTTTW